LGTQERSLERSRKKQTRKRKWKKTGPIFGTPVEGPMKKKGNGTCAGLQKRKFSSSKTSRRKGSKAVARQKNPTKEILQEQLKHKLGGKERDSTGKRKGAHALRISLP